jgi:hypothetical protein
VVRALSRDAQADDQAVTMYLICRGCFVVATAILALIGKLALKWFLSRGRRAAPVQPPPACPKATTAGGTPGRSILGIRTDPAASADAGRVYGEAVQTAECHRTSPDTCAGRRSSAGNPRTPLHTLRRRWGGHSGQPPRQQPATAAEAATPPHGPSLDGPCLSMQHGLKDDSDGDEVDDGPVDGGFRSMPVRDDRQIALLPSQRAEREQLDEADDDVGKKASVSVPFR